jgi:diaminobutyrate-2-oxoglutarate transaminase
MGRTRTGWIRMGCIDAGRQYDERAVVQPTSTPVREPFSADEPVDSHADLVAPHVNGTVPGPASQRALDRQEAHESNARSYPRNLPIAIRRGAGSYVEDLDGNVFIDFLMSAGVLALGHSQPEVVEAVQRQAALLITGLDFPTAAKEAFTELQIAHLPEGMRERTKIQFCGPAGENAVDAALKLCKTATGRADIVTFHGGFHGSTHSAMALTGLTSQKRAVANTMPGVHFFPYPSRRHSALGGDPETIGERCLEYFEHALRDPLGGIPLPAAVILEVVQGEGGAVAAPSVFVQGVRRVTRELGIPLIVDEVQSGWGRTGTWWAFEQHGIEPDVIVASKAIGGIGLPIAIIMYDKALDVWSPGAHTGTFRGNQLAFVAGVEGARIMERDHVLDNVREQGAYALEGLRELQRKHALACDARGVGLMLGLEVEDPAGGSPAPIARAIQRAAINRGLILELGGRHDAVLRLLPPLNVTRKTLDQALAILSDAIAHVAAGA